MNAIRPANISILPTLLLPVSDALEERGVDPERFLKGMGIDRQKLLDTDGRVPRERFRAIMQRALEVTGDESFGLTAAAHLRPQELQALGLSWLASDSIYDGMRRVSRFVRFVSTGCDLWLEESADRVHVWIKPALSPTEPLYAMLDFGLGMLVQMCRFTVGDRVAPLAAQVARPEPNNPAPWQTTLCEKVQFETEGSRLSWRLADVEQRLVTGDPILARVVDQRAQDYLDALLGKSMASDVADRIVRHLPDGAPAQAEIAAELNISSRTLQRRLQSEGVSFAGLLQDVRRELAHTHLCEHNRSVLETAYLLGFSEPSTFSRAFKNWTGLAPAEYREQKRAA